MKKQYLNALLLLSVAAGPAQLFITSTTVASAEDDSTVISKIEKAICASTDLFHSSVDLFDAFISTSDNRTVAQHLEDFDRMLYKVDRVLFVAKECASSAHDAQVKQAASAVVSIVQGQQSLGQSLRSAISGNRNSTLGMSMALRKLQGSAKSTLGSAKSSATKAAALSTLATSAQNLKDKIEWVLRQDRPAAQVVKGIKHRVNCK